MDDSPKKQLQSDCLCGRDHIKAGDASHVAADFDARLSHRPACVVFVTTGCIIPKLPLQTTPDWRLRPLCCSPWPFPWQGLLKQHHPASGVTARNCAASYQSRPSRSRLPSMSFRACAVKMHVPSPHTLSRMYQHFSVAFTVRHAMYWPLSPEAIRGRGALSLHGRTSLLLIPTSKVMCGQRPLHLPDFNSELRTWAFNCWTSGEHRQKSFYERSLLASEKNPHALPSPLPDINSTK